MLKHLDKAARDAYLKHRREIIEREKKARDEYLKAVHHHNQINRIKGTLERRKHYMDYRGQNIAFRTGGYRGWLDYMHRHHPEMFQQKKQEGQGGQRGQGSQGPGAPEGGNVPGKGPEMPAGPQAPEAPAPVPAMGKDDSVIAVLRRIDAHLDKIGIKDAQKAIIVRSKNKLFLFPRPIVIVESGNEKIVSRDIRTLESCVFEPD